MWDFDGHQTKNEDASFAKFCFGYGEELDTCCVFCVFLWQQEARDNLFKHQACSFELQEPVGYISRVVKSVIPLYSNTSRI
jgi:hypothetical protein